VAHKDLAPSPLRRNCRDRGRSYTIRACFAGALGEEQGVVAVAAAVADAAASSPSSGSSLLARSSSAPLVLSSSSTGGARDGADDSAPRPLGGDGHTSRLLRAMMLPSGADSEWRRTRRATVVDASWMARLARWRQEERARAVSLHDAVTASNLRLAAEAS